MNYQEYPEQDELRARFTRWLQTVTYHARLKYLRRQSRQVKTVSFEELPEDALRTPSPALPLEGKTLGLAFDFEEERLARAFSSLPIKRQQILTMLFVEERKPEEIAKILNCSSQHVYDQRYQALKKLRQALAKGGDTQ